MASVQRQDSMMLALAVGATAEKEPLTAENNAIAEITLNDADTARVKKYVRLNGKLYLVGMECHIKPRQAEPK